MDNLFEAIRLALFQTRKTLFVNFRFDKWMIYGVLSLISIGGLPSLNMNSNSPDFPLAIAAVFLVITITVLVAYIIIKPQMRFILMDSVLKCDINYNKSKEIFKKRSGSYLGWILFLILMTILIAILIVGVIVLIGTAFIPLKPVSPSSAPKDPMIMLILIALLSMFSLLLFVPIGIYLCLIENITITSMMKMPEGTSVFDAIRTFNPLFKRYWKDMIWFLVAMMIIGIITSAIISMFTFPAYFAYGIASIFIDKYPVISIFTALLMFAFVFIVLCMMYPAIGVFITAFQMAYISKVFPGFEILLIAEKDNYGKITASKTMYDIEREEEEKRLAEEREITDNMDNADNNYRQTQSEP